MKRKYKSATVLAVLIIGMAAGAAACGTESEKVLTDSETQEKLPQPYAAYVAVLEQILNELTAWIATSYYENGIVQEWDSHNHGRDPYERGTYPYRLYQYDGETDSYRPFVLRERVGRRAVHR